MKKLFALILCAVMLLSCASLAETAEKESLGTVKVNGAFELKCVIPEGYSKTLLPTAADQVIALFSSEDEDKPRITVSIAYNDSYAADGVALKYNDISEEDVELIRESFLQACDEAEFQDGETAHGTKLLLVKGKLGEEQFMDVYTIYNAYEIEIIATYGEDGEGKTLSEDQMQKMIDFVSDLDFVEI